jgi:RND superfamily putative drug exporter
MGTTFDCSSAKAVRVVTVTPVLDDLGRMLHRWRRPVLATWAALVVLGAVLGGSVFDVAEAPEPLRDDAESAQVARILEAADPEGELVVAVLSGADIYGIDLIDQATRVLHDVRDLPDVVEVRDPWTTGAQDLVKPDRTGTIVTVEIDHTVDRERALAAAADVEETLQLVGMPEVLVGGPLLAEEAFGEQAVQDAARGEGVAILVLVVVLALALGGLVVGLLPVVTALGSVSVALLALAGMARLTPVSEYAVNVVRSGQPRRAVPTSPTCWGARWPPRDVRSSSPASRSRPRWQDCSCSATPCCHPWRSVASSRWRARP